MARNQNLCLKVPRTLVSPSAGIVDFPCPIAGTIVRARVQCEVAPDGGTALFDLNVNGVSIWAGDQTQRVAIADGQTSNARTPSAAVAVDDVLTLDFDGLTGTATGIGTYIRVTISIEETGASASDSELGGGGGAQGIRMNIAGSQRNNYATTDWDIPIVDEGSWYDEDAMTPILPDAGWYAATLNLRLRSTVSDRMQIVLSGGSSDVCASLPYPPATTSEVFNVTLTALFRVAEEDLPFVISVIIGQFGTPDFVVETASYGTNFTVVKL